MTINRNLGPPQIYTRMLWGFITVLLSVLFWAGQSWISAAEARDSSTAQRVTQLERQYERIDAKLEQLLERTKPGHVR